MRFRDGMHVSSMFEHVFEQEERWGIAGEAITETLMEMPQFSVVLGDKEKINNSRKDSERHKSF